jgi:hypothetical protein
MTLKRKLGIAAVLVVVVVGGLIAVLGKRESEPPIVAMLVRYETNVTNAAVTAVVQITNHSRFEVVTNVEPPTILRFHLVLYGLDSIQRRK